MPRCTPGSAIIVMTLLLAGCGDTQSARLGTPPAQSSQRPRLASTGDGKSSARNDSGALPNKIKGAKSAGCHRVKTVCHILFIGNSYTYVNDLPHIVTELARAGNESVVAEAVANPNATLLTNAASAEAAIRRKASTWNVVVLQEQSQIPALAQLREERMYPTARRLVRLVDDVGAEPMFFLTPARRLGWPEVGLKGYESMQLAVEQGYLDIARELKAAIAPAGVAWSAARARRNSLDLWRADGSHPTILGSYLTGCVFYAAILHKPATRLSYHANLPSRLAAELQAIATKTVLDDPLEWNLKQ